MAFSNMFKFLTACDMVFPADNASRETAPAQYCVPIIFGVQAEPGQRFFAANCILSLHKKAPGSETILRGVYHTRNLTTAMEQQFPK